VSGISVLLLLVLLAFVLVVLVLLAFVLMLLVLLAFVLVVVVSKQHRILFCCRPLLL